MDCCSPTHRKFFFKEDNDEKYIKVDEWNNVSLERSASHIYKFNNQTFSVNKFIKKIN